MTNALIEHDFVTPNDLRHSVNTNVQGLGHVHLFNLAGVTPNPSDLTRIQFCRVSIYATCLATQASVISVMKFCASCPFQILNSIIELIPVNVINLWLSLGLAPKPQLSTGEPTSAPC